MSNTSFDRIMGEILREWRISQNLELSELANSVSLSVAQLQQLETGGVSLFYTASIKENAARKVASVLGINPDSVIRSVDGEVFPQDFSVMDGLVHLSKEDPPQNVTTGSFLRHSVLVVTLLLVFGASVASFGWFQKKWQSGGSEQFWRQTVSSSPNKSLTLLEPEYIQLQTSTDSKNLIKRTELQEN